MKLRAGDLWARSNWMLFFILALSSQVFSTATFLVRSVVVTQRMHKTFAPLMRYSQEQALNIQLASVGGLLDSLTEVAYCVARLQLIARVRVRALHLQAMMMFRGHVNCSCG
jgi:hypothetical protein